MLFYSLSSQDFKEATKKMDLWSTPPLLCVHLKRFAVDATASFWADKLETPVAFPVEGLDVRPFCANPANHLGLYALGAVANHFGGAGGGHYTAHARSEANGRWYEFDDSRVSEVNATLGAPSFAPLPYSPHPIPAVPSTADGGMYAAHTCKCHPDRPGLVPLGLFSLHAQRDLAYLGLSPAP
jgi:hypothetical protein